MPIKKLVAAATLILIGAFPIELQKRTGSLEGVVVDQWGPVAAASLTARHLIKGVTAHGRSDVHGYYRIDDLPPGNYSIWIEASGHDSMWVMRVQVECGRAAQQNVFIRKQFGGITSLEKPSLPGYAGTPIPSQIGF